MIHGAKWWMIFPSTAHKYLDDEYDMLGCDASCSDEDISILDYYSNIWSNSSELSFDGASISHVFQNEGETLYIPSNMIHR